MSIDNAKKKTTKRMKKTDYPPEIDVFLHIKENLKKVNYDLSNHT
jgi:hypothetical protein